jgi:hypothetical protein
LLGHNTGETVTDALVSLVSGDRFAGILDLQEQLDTLDGSDSSLGDSCGNTADEEVGGEGPLVLFGSAHFSYCLFV